MTAKYTIKAVTEAQAQGPGLFRYISPDLILPNPKQPRRTLEPEAFATLRESIRERGILQPLLLMRGQEGYYILIAGQRRLAAARELGLIRVPVMILNEIRPDYLVDSLLENIQREELSGIDEGQSFIALKEEFGWSQREIAARLHKHESYVSERIRTAERLTAITKEIISDAMDDDENLARAKFSHSINRKLALLPASEQEDLARLVAKTKNITARQIEDIVRQKQKFLGNSIDTNPIQGEMVASKAKEDTKPKRAKTQLSKNKLAQTGQLTLDAVWGIDPSETLMATLPKNGQIEIKEGSSIKQKKTKQLSSQPLPTKIELEIDLNEENLKKWPQLATLIGTSQTYTGKSSIRLSQIIKALGL
jgi:ParB/RepB/Spo0J family partition protein